MSQTRICDQCHVVKHDWTINDGCFWMDNWYCSKVCRHDAGDRTACWKKCACTRYAKKRRILRAHRAEMRIMDDFIWDHGLGHELNLHMLDEIGNPGLWLGYSSEFDETSDKEDPEKTLRKEIDDKRHFLEAAKSTLILRQITTEVERARMEMEDMRSHVCR